MESKHLEDIWARQEVSALPEQTLQDFRKAYASNNRVKARWANLFDAALKTLLAAGYFSLLFWGDSSWAKTAWIMGVVMLMAGAVFYNQRIRQRLANIAPLGIDVLTALKREYRFAQRHFLPQLLLLSLTPPFFVLLGFQYYLFFKYGEDRWAVLLQDPVTYVFLLLALAIPLVAHFVNQARELGDLEELLSVEWEEAEEAAKVRQLQRRRRLWKIAYLLLALLGVLLCSIFIISLL